MDMKKSFLLAALAGSAMAQVSVLSLPAGNYLKPSTTPTSLRGVLTAIGNRVQATGQERLTLAGTYIGSNGTQSIQIVWQVPGEILINFLGGAAHTIVFNGSTTATNGATPSAADNDLVESLADDRAEALLYNLRFGSVAMRILGGQFRPAGVGAAYAGPFYDIFQTLGRVSSRSDKPTRQKQYLFDSAAHTLVEARYQTTNSGAAAFAETVYSGWSLSNGQSVPGQIVRRENEATVFTIQVTSSQVGPALNDGLFTVNP
jgi:hypothetical protein